MSRTHRLRWLPEAYNDLRDARDWYDGQSAGLGAEFIAAFWQTLDSIDRFPRTPRLVEIDGKPDELRSWHFGDSWPYSVVYLVEGDVLVVMAVAHDRRNPPSWAKRLRQR